jgi:signal peptidase II
MVRTLIPLGQSWSPWSWLEPYVRIVHWQNTGAAFGMFQRFGMVFTVLAFIVSIGILYYYPQVPRKDWAMRLAMAMMLGGAVGNLIDRLAQGTVTDFVSVGTFAVFNVADACISVGTLILILALWNSERKQKKLAETSQLQSSLSPEPPEPQEQLDTPPDPESHPVE